MVNISWIVLVIPGHGAGSGRLAAGLQH